jgi:hypothetical protein
MANNCANHKVREAYKSLFADGLFIFDARKVYKGDSKATEFDKYSAGTYTPRRRTVAMGGWTTIMKAVIPAWEL